jgi:7-cyano-7-deazaguanine synthase in queuosine biosynthesis
MKRTSKRSSAGSYAFDPGTIPTLFLRPELLRSANALAVAASAFNIEKAFRTGHKIRNCRVLLYNAKPHKYDLKRLGTLLHDLMIFVLAEDIDFTLKTIGLGTRSPRPIPTFRTGRSVCLFSGGVDSYAGILLARQRSKDIAGVFAAHSDQARMIHIVRKLEKKILGKLDIDLHELRVPSVGAQGYAQLRGFLYMVGAAAWINLLQADTLLVTECGPTMYQPRFSPFDSITMTTHPVVVQFAKMTIAALLQREIEIVTPFEDLTKAEVFAISPEKAGLRYTHSCISQRFGRHDGTCYGCVIRRLAAVAAQVNDVRYDRNPIADKRANAGNLMSLLAYSYDLLTDYSRMDTYEVEIIESYRKQNLFRRFALDNFAAIHILIKGGHRVRLPILQMYKDLIREIGTEPLTARLRDLKRATFVPAF